MKREELQREILVRYLSDLVEAREQLQRIERNARRYLKEHKKLKAAYDAFNKAGGGTLGDLTEWLASYQHLPTLAQRKHVRLVVANDLHGWEDQWQIAEQNHRKEDDMSQQRCLSALISLITITAIAASAFVTLTTETVAQTVPTDLPLGFMCWNEKTQSWGVAYLAGAEKDGTATYMPPGGRLSATVNTKRVVEPPRDRPANFRLLR